MKSIRNRFNLDSDIWNNRKNTNDGNQCAKRSTVSVSQRNKIGNRTDFIDSRNSNDFIIDE